MRLGLYLVASFLFAMVLISVAARDHAEMTINTVIVWAPPALLAVATRNKATTIGRYLPPALALVFMLTVMLRGMS
jgi:hypothetical protein